MTEIRIDVDLPHPPTRVWKALTDPQILREWFINAEFSAGDCPTNVVLRPSGQGGFDDPIECEVLEAKTAERLVMRWTSTQLHTRVTVTLRAGGRGCVLTGIQEGYLGTQGVLRRRALRNTYTRLFGQEGLYAALERLEIAERERERDSQQQRNPLPSHRFPSNRNQARFFSAVPRQASVAWQGLKAAGRNMSLRSSSGFPPFRRWPTIRGVAAPAGETLSEATTASIRKDQWAGYGVSHREVTYKIGRWRMTASSRQRTMALVSLLILILLGALAVLTEKFVHPGDPDSSTVGNGRKLPLMSGSAVPDSGNPNTLSSVSAIYRTGRTVMGGYEGVVTVNNLSSSAVNGWSIRMVLPPLGLIVHDVKGALAQQNGREVRFVPEPQTKVIPAGESVQFIFQVQGFGAPTECFINDRPCSGLPE